MKTLQSQPSGLPRPPGHVDIFTTRFADLPDDCRILSNAEKERASRFVRKSDAARYRTGRAWMRRRIAAVLGVSPGGLPLAAGPHGKPELPGHPVHFNLTHTEEEAWLAISASPVGIDLELPPAGDLEPLFRQIASPEEWRHAGTHGITVERFLLLWTAKEAVLKLLGTGLMADPRSFTLGPLDTPGPRCLVIDGRQICLQRLPARRGAAAHVAATGDSLEIRLHGPQGGTVF